MTRSVFSIASAVAAWGLLWTVTNLGMAAAFPTRFDEAGFPNDSVVLVGFIAICVVLCVGAGWLCAALVGRSEMAHVKILALIQLAIGVGVQWSVWDQMPVWYHVIFLGVVFPMHLVGGRFRVASSRSSVSLQSA